MEIGTIQPTLNWDQSYGLPAVYIDTLSHDRPVVTTEDYVTAPEEAVKASKASVKFC